MPSNLNYTKTLESFWFVVMCYILALTCRSHNVIHFQLVYVHYFFAFACVVVYYHHFVACVY